MDITIEQRAQFLIDACMELEGIDVIELFEQIADQEFVRIHGPEHHILDGAVILAAYAHAGGKIDLKKSLEEMKRRGLMMPGAACGMWGVCGAVSSIGAALCIIDGTGPLTTDGSWGKHMEFTANALMEIGKTKGPRCCKRDGFLSLIKAVEFINDNYGVHITAKPVVCHYHNENQQCIGKKCPFRKEIV